MRFLANENFPGTAVKALITAGHDVAWVRNAGPGMSDPDVAATYPVAIRSTGMGWATGVGRLGSFAGCS
jgi:Domain of unknown function (DUF5615)